MPIWPASFIAARVRSSASIRSANHSAVAGTLARSASTTGLRPATHSGPPATSRDRLLDCERVPPDRPPADDVVRFAAARALRCAGWLGRSEAFGVGPLPLSCLRRWAPEPTVWPFFDP